VDVSDGQRTNASESPRVVAVARLFHPWIGGTERQALKLARTLVDQGGDVRIVTGWWFRGTPQTEEVEGIRVFRNHTLWKCFGIRGLRKFGGYLYLITLLWHLWRTRRTYDVIHVHALNYHTAVAAFAGHILHKPTLVKLANSGRASDIDKMRNDEQLPLVHLLLPIALRCDRFVASNATIVRELTAAGVPAERISRIPNGVEADRIRAKASYRPSDPTVITYVGRLHQQKGVDTLLRAFGRLAVREAAVHVRLDVVGDGPLRGQLKALADELGIADRVRFLGSSDRVPDLLEASDVFVLPSRAEGLSNALLEAMASGLPCVVSNVPGNVDVITDGDDGLLFTVDDPDALAETLTRVVRSPALREALGRSARRTVETTYALEHVAHRYADLYAALCRTPYDEPHDLVAPTRLEG
jgi:glycosyltransferase involved in cell wall biosynthesis